MVGEGTRHYLHDVWWMLLVRGLSLVLFGVIAVAWPGITLFVLSLAFAIWLLVAGVVDVIRGLGAEGKERLWFLTVLLGVLELGVGVYALRGPELTLKTFIVLAGLALVVKGILEVVAAFEDAYDPGLRMLMIIVGAVTTVAGIIVLRYPATSLDFVWALGVFALIAGPLNIAASLSLKSAADNAL